MQTFKLCMKIYEKNALTMGIFIAIFVGISLFIASSGGSAEAEDFSQAKINIAFISHDDSLLIDAFQNYMSRLANFVELQDSERVLQDALFSGQIRYIITIPQGFTAAFFSENSESMMIQKTARPADNSTRYIDMAIQQYFNIAKLYTVSLRSFSEERIVENITRNLTLESEVILASSPKSKNVWVYAQTFYNFLAYSLLAVLMLGISLSMRVFQNKDSKQRMECSPLSKRDFTVQIFLANLVFAIFVWFVMSTLCLLFQRQGIFNTSIALYSLNSLLLTFWAASLSFLIGGLVSNRNTIMAITNVLALGSSFIGGVFVPQELLGEGLLTFARFIPTFWYVKANSLIAQTPYQQALSPELWETVGIQAIFGVAFLSLALLIGKKKRYR